MHLGALALALVVCALPVAAKAQPAGKVYRIGFLGSVSAAANKNRLEAFRQGLRNLGYAEGRNILIEYRWAEGDYERLPGLARELVGRKPDLIVSTGGQPTVRALRAVTTTVPVVFLTSDPVAEGIVLSLGRPGGNFTGLDVFSVELDTKRLGLLKETLPNASRVVFLLNPGNPSALPQRNRIEIAAQMLRVRLQLLEARLPDEIDTAFAAMARERPDALLLMADPMLDSQRKRIVGLAMKNRLPAVYQWREFAAGGGLMSYGADLLALYRRLPMYVDKVLKGAKPAELPVEQPTKYELVVNLKTAKALGVTIPQSILLRADEVIQ
jgi:putative ABC transport system substrate-binding protein